MTGHIKMTLLSLFLILYMHTDTETQQFGDQAHTAVCINVSLFISYHCILISDECQTLDTHESHSSGS